VTKERLPIAVSLFNRYEFQNAIRFAAFRRAISDAEAIAALDAFESDLKSGHLQLISVDLPAALAEASNLSARHTISGGHRSFDILHVAVARILKATTFLTFDKNQSKLAKSVRLAVGP
jgi:predicted nucleic acid-binding protein